MTQAAANASFCESLSRFLPVRVRALVKQCISPKYRVELRLVREISRLRSLPRYHFTTSAILGVPLEIPDGPSFAEMYDEIFGQELYAFRTKNPEPYIIDGGANIGLTILYFKSLFPRCEVVGFEADQRIFDILQRNTKRSGYQGIRLRCYALSGSEQPVQFLPEGSYAGRIVRKTDPEGEKVQSVRLREYLDRPVDLLKLNIEGAETEVLEDCAKFLPNVENIALEYHSFATERQTLHTLLNILAESGFRIHVRPSRSAPQPLLHREVLLGMDLQLYIFGFRERKEL